MKVFIVGGAGIVGSATAFYLATQQIADEVVLQDLNENAVLSHAMDLSQCAFLTSGTKIRSGTWEDAVGSDVVVIAAGVPAAIATHDACKDIHMMRPLIRSIAEGVNKYCPEAVVLSLTNPLDAFNYVLYHACGLPGRQFIAMSVNDSLRFRWSLAEHLGLAPSAVDGYVIGEHGPAKIPLFSTVTVNGKPRAFDKVEQEQVMAEVNGWWKRFLDVSGTRTASWTTGSSCALTIEHLAGRRSGPICCSYIMEDGLSIGYPVLLNQNGVVGPAELRLAEDEAVRFEAAKANAKASIAKVLSYLEENA